MSVSLASGAGSTQSASLSMYVGLYTRNGSSLSLASSGSTLLTASLNGSTGQAFFNNARIVQIPININATPGDYWLAFNYSSSRGNAGLNVNLSHRLMVSANSAISNTPVWGVSNVSVGFIPGCGSWSTSTAGMPTSMALSDVVGSSNFPIPLIYIGNTSQ
jgi:hypothetical protein